ncbi:quinone oxidoreductase [Leisingera sp. ANG59]|uniref:quinone oxidoreductase family protein n=1 Tax=Leisingera sp. ANG59 TaxID=2675221 RepID=UPI0015728C32|nr:quinone oxidoreductase [Leisingera sp. ANG59]
MTSIVFDSAGPPSVLYAIDKELPQPGPGEVLIEMTSVGVNFIDVYLRSGQLPGELHSQSGIGVEGVGRIAALGGGVQEFSIGDRVATVGGAPGSYSTHRLFPQERVLPLPAEVADDIAAALLFKGLTVEYLINRCFPVQAGQTVLWHAAAGGIGRIAGQWLIHKGANLIGVVGSEDKRATAETNGFDNVLLSSSPSFGEDVQALTGGQGVDVAYDSVGAATFDQSLKALKPRGTLVLFGNASGKVDGFDTSRLGAQGSVYLTRPSIAHYIADQDEFRMAAGTVLTAIREGIIRAGKINRFELSEAAEVHRALEGRQLVGPTIMSPAAAARKGGQHAKVE